MNIHETRGSPMWTSPKISNFVDSDKFYMLLFTIFGSHGKIFRDPMGALTPRSWKFADLTNSDPYFELLLIVSGSRHDLSIWQTPTSSCVVIVKNHRFRLFMLVFYAITHYFWSPDDSIVWGPRACAYGDLAKKIAYLTYFGQFYMLLLIVFWVLQRWEILGKPRVPFHGDLPQS